MHKMFLATVVIALLPSGVAAKGVHSGPCVTFVENGGMGEHVEKSKAQTMCHDPAYKAKALKALDNMRNNNTRP
jgi:hypothetical protein